MVVTLLGALFPRNRLHLFIVPSCDQQKKKKSAPCETKRERNVGGVDQKGESWADRTIHEIIVVKEVDECRQPNQ